MPNPVRITAEVVNVRRGYSRLTGQLMAEVNVRLDCGSTLTATARPDAMSLFGYRLAIGALVVLDESSDGWPIIVRVE